MIPHIPSDEALTLPPRAEPSILAIIVLYKMSVSESASVCTLLQILKSDPDLAEHFSLVLYDNSPNSHPVEGDVAIPVHYHHDPSNAGLAPAYNYAVAQAGKAKSEWLLLLDQDTSLTHNFVLELVACAGEMGDHQQVASIVPKLLVSGVIHSPAAHYIDQLRHQYKRTNHAVTEDIVGMQPGRLAAYNSGATIRVSALQAIGGFPEVYWLDYLDHAVCHALSVHGFTMYIMKAMLKHDSSQADLRSVPVWRERSFLFAQTHFVKQTGNFFDRLLYRIWLLRRSRILLKCFPETPLWKEAALQALLMQEMPKVGSHDALLTRPSM